MKILVTGASGFVGRALCRHLASLGHSVVPVVRQPRGLPGEQVISDMDEPTAWSELLRDCEGVVHLAARVHQMQDSAADTWRLYRATNMSATIALARAAASAGIKRLVFISTIKVNGEGGDRAYRADDIPTPEDPYAMSKWEAEQGLHEIARETGLEVVILRPPLIYGAGVRANFLKLMAAVDRGWPLPLGAVHNRRGMVYLGNLCDAIAVSLTHTAAAGKTFLPCDAEEVSTPELITRLAQSMGRKPRLIPVPLSLLRFAGWLFGKSRQVDRVLGSLVLDSSTMRETLGWTPPYSMEQGLKKTAAWYRDSKKQS